MYSAQQGFREGEHLPYPFLKKTIFNNPFIIRTINIIYLYLAGNWYVIGGTCGFCFVFCCLLLFFIVAFVFLECFSFVFVMLLLCCFVCFCLLFLRVCVYAALCVCACVRAFACARVCWCYFFNYNSTVEIKVPKNASICFGRVDSAFRFFYGNQAELRLNYM